MKDKLLHAVTQYDLRESKKRSYNRYALGIYFERVDAVCADVSAGAEPRAAILAGFSGRLADACLKALGLSNTSESENHGGAWSYTPVSEKRI